MVNDMYINPPEKVTPIFILKLRLISYWGLIKVYNPF